MKIILTGLFCFGLWATGTTYWYLCKIENMCLTEQSNNKTAINSNQIAHDKGDIEKQASVEVAPEVSTIENDDDAIAESSNTEENDNFPLDKNITYYFNFNTENPEVGTGGNKDLQDMVNFLTKNPQIKVTITGHTDNIGANEANYKLGLKRATSTAKLLEAKGIESSRINTFSKGEAMPLASNDHEEGRAKNRRIEIKLIK